MWIITVKFERLTCKHTLAINTIHYIAVILIAACAFLFTCSNDISAQPGGKAFQFLEITNSARVAALGGDVVAIGGSDAELPYHNPALMSQEMHHHMALNYVNYFAGANFGYASAITKLNQKSELGCGIHYLYYGTFQGADENGVKTGTFRAADYSVNIMYARKIDSLLTLGVTAKNIYSDYEQYNATAFAFDVGLVYADPDRKISAGIVLRNMGMQVDAYTANNAREPLPFNIAIGLSKGLAYAPFTFHVELNHLEKWDLTYVTQADRDKEELDLQNGQPTGKNDFDVFFDKFMRHVVMGTTVSLGKSFEIRAGYNYRRRQELKVDTSPGTVGFSWGVGLNLKKFKIGYGRSIYHLAGGSNHFSLSMNLDELNKNF
jgi:hypothetical protein